jgi:hypothetical protein
MAQGQLMGGLDSNLDGKLQPAELRGTTGERLKANFAALDTNHDGVLDKAELAGAAAIFRRPGGGQRAAAPEPSVRPVASN